ncbi:MAG: hypothetical protein U0236_07740 [Nitrospira sp.]
MKSAIKQFASKVGTIYAECGGLMYLTQAIRDLTVFLLKWLVCFGAEATMQRTGMTLGYRSLTRGDPRHRAGWTYCTGA